MTLPEAVQLGIVATVFVATFVDETIAMFALMLTLWLVAMRVVGIGTDSASPC